MIPRTALPRPALPFLFLLLLLARVAPLTGAPAAAATEPHWIWTTPTAGTPDPAGDPDGTQTAWFRHTFRTPPYTWNARLSLSAPAGTRIFLNARPVAVARAWDEPVRAEVSMNLLQGDNVLAVRVPRPPGQPGLLLHLQLGGTETRHVFSNPDWLVTSTQRPDWLTPEFDPSGWSPAVSLGTHGVEPWGRLLDRPVATPAESLQLLPGFEATLLRSARPDEGSWIALAIDPQGRIVVAPEGDGHPLWRFTLAPDGSVTDRQSIPAPIRASMGLLFAHGSLYANARGPEGNGLYRLTDTNGNDRFDPDEVRLLKRFGGGGEHGYHAVTLGPDDRIYVLNGNTTGLPEGLSPHSPFRNAAEDVLSLNPDETHAARGALAPGGYVVRTDPDGRTWELVAAGLRNAYDFDFDPDGELFTWDSDNEWDWGTPWYRPTRVFHLVSGAEIGWRDGTRAWPDHYPDAIPGVVDIGLGSPTGVRFGTRARFPEKYRRALYLQDWSYGRILAVHLAPHGATYRGTFEEFLKGQPLNLTALAFGPDGALYFTTGGRGTQSGLYRVTCRDPLAPADLRPDLAAPPSPARQQRQALERFHGRDRPGAVEAVWDSLGHPDPALRFAARVALEAQDLPGWLPLALAESQPTRALTALLALARTGGPEHQPDLFRALARFPLAGLDEEHRLLKYRVLQLSFLRQGRPSPDWTSRAIERLGPLYPAPGWRENFELARLLIYLEAPSVVGRTLDLLAAAPSQQQQIHYLAQLRHLRSGWTPPDRERYFNWWLQPRDHLPQPGSLLHWFHDVGRDYVDGTNLDRHLESFRRDAIAHLPESERDALRPLLDAPIVRAQVIPPQPRSFVREWTLDDLLPQLDRASHSRNFERGRRAFIDAQCYLCHRFGNAGGSIGPDITATASKYGRRELLESLIDPSRVIPDQYQNVRIFLHDGDDVTGRLLAETDAGWTLETDPLSATERFVPRADADSIEPSPISGMPEGLLNGLTAEDILDLIAFIEAAGRSDAPAFQSPVQSPDTRP